MARSFLPLSIKKRIPTILALVITVLFGYLATVRASLTDESFLTSLERRWIDSKFRFRGERLPGPEVVVVGIDENSMNDPAWGSGSSLQHDKMATVIRNLAKRNPKVIGFDILFGDPDGVNEEDPSKLSRKDQELADAIKEAGNVVLGVYLDLKTDPAPRQKVESTTLTAELDELSGRKGYLSSRCYKGPCNPHEFFQGRNLRLSLPGFLAGAQSFGYVNFHPDQEGRLRHQPQAINYMGQFYASLDLQLIRAYLDQGSPLLEQEGDLIQAVTLGNGDQVPVDEFGRYMLNFNGKGGLGPEGSRRIISIIDVLKDDPKRAAPEFFEGKIVLIGAEAIGSTDIRPTPFDPVYPGVELHADIIDNILHQNYLTRNGMQFFDVFVILIFGILLGLYLPRMNAARAIFYSGLLLVLFTVVNVFSFTIWNLVLGYVYPGIALVFTSASLIGYQYLTEEREKNRTRQTFQYYLDPNMIEQVMTQPDALKLGGEKREMSVLFSDIRGFTSFSEKMAPTEVVNFLNQYFDKMTGLIFQYKGTLDKLIGDAVMCFWGHPLEIKDHAVKATLCALEMIQAVEDLRPVLILPGGARFDIGIGVNTGQMVVGNMGAQSRFSYTVMGDNVNLGSRLESLNKYYGTKILISDATYEECKDVIFCRELDKIQVKGKSQAVTIYEPLGVRSRSEDRRTRRERRGAPTLGGRIKKAYVLARYRERRKEGRRAASSRLLLTPQQEEFATIYEHALALYRSADFDAAEKAFDHVLSLNPSDGPSRLMKNRIEKYRMEYIGTESTFDPVYKFDEK